jgi:23S rRNA (cytidine1920-2'-O)/16S rRNA (cytidine1409-2'-O)-methyltransferase
MATERLRLDKALVERGLVISRERAQALILAGRVLVDEQKVSKPGAAIAEGAALRLLGEEMRYVSRGGLKLEAALAHWGIDLAARACLDVGASTGGFTDCMLQHGAVSVLAVDTGYGQIAQKLRSDERVSLMERTNARLLVPGDAKNGLPEGITFLAMDVAFISATLVLPPVIECMKFYGVKHSSWQGECVVLIKPQFETGRENVGKGGIVRDPAAHQLAIDRVTECVRSLGGESLEIIDSPIHGMEGNKEFLLHAKWV